MTKSKPSSRAGLPTREQLQDFIRGHEAFPSRREVVRAFRVPRGELAALTTLLNELRPRRRRKAEAERPSLPRSVMVEVTAIDTEDGTPLARPLEWEGGPGAAPTVVLRDSDRPAGAIAIGTRGLARITGSDSAGWEGRLIRIVESAPERVVGVYETHPQGDRIRPTDRRVKAEIRVDKSRAGGAGPGEVVVAEIMPARRLGLPQGRVVQRLGGVDDPRSFSLIAIHNHGIPDKFPAETVAAATALRPAPLGRREDLRGLPLVTIDGADARDFDDAVFAEPDPDPGNAGGFHLIVAIADVAWYVRPGDALDREAQERGNSVYFPDRVVPMLPERLSNDLCSLRPREDRPCLAMHLWIDADGRTKRHRLKRAMIHSAARLTYEQVQAAADGRPNAPIEGLAKDVIARLYAAYAALARARDKRGTLDLDLEELEVKLGEDGHVDRVAPRARLDSHRLIEEFMIAANVAAATLLDDLRRPCMFRVHDPPEPDRVDSLRTVLDSLGYRLAKGQVMRPQHFRSVLEWATGTPHERLVHALVLRTQSMAVYSPVNHGHFGLALPRYAHFTSPIRRYADLLVHRGLIAALELGQGGHTAPDPASFRDLGEHLSTTERRAAAAERAALERYMAAYLSERTGAEFAGRISGVARFGVFVTLDGLGADGLIPIAALPNDFYHHDPDHHSLTGRRHGRRYALGDAIDVRLKEADAVTGSLLLEPVGGAADVPTSRQRPPPWHRHRGRR